VPGVGQEGGGVGASLGGVGERAVRSWCSAHCPPGQMTVACSTTRPAVRQSCPHGSRVEVAGWELHVMRYSLPGRC